MLVESFLSSFEFAAPKSSLAVFSEPEEVDFFESVLFVLYLSAIESMSVEESVLELESKSV